MALNLARCFLRRFPFLHLGFADMGGLFFLMQKAPEGGSDAFRCEELFKVLCYTFMFLRFHCISKYCPLSVVIIKMVWLYPLDEVYNILSAL